MSKAASNAPATRELRSVTAAVEKRLLVWIARRVPERVNADHLTGLGFLGLLGASASFALARWWPATLFAVPLWLAVNWLGDSLDGTLARVRDQQRPRYGFYVDHVLDAAGTAALLGGMGASGYLTPTIALGLLAAYFLVVIEVALATCVRSVFRMSVLGVGPTELRVLVAVGAVGAAFKPAVTLLGTTRPFFDVAGIAGIAGLGAVFVTAAVRNTLVLSREEPRPIRVLLS